MRAAIAKRLSGDAAPERLHFFRIQSVSVTRRVLVSAPEARSAEGDEGGAAALVSFAADLYQRQAHVSLSHPYIYRISTEYPAQIKFRRERA